MLLINPGALASGSLFTRQAVQTVAILSISEDGTPLVTHVDLNDPTRAFVPDIDWEADFDAALRQTQTPIVEQDLIANSSALMRETYADLDALVEAILPLCRPCWEGRKLYVTRRELIDQIEGVAQLPCEDREKALAILAR